MCVCTYTICQEREAAETRGMMTRKQILVASAGRHSPAGKREREQTLRTGRQGFKLWSAANSNRDCLRTARPVQSTTRDKTGYTQHHAWCVVCSSPQPMGTATRRRPRLSKHFIKIIFLIIPCGERDCTCAHTLTSCSNLAVFFTQTNCTEPTRAREPHP